MYACGPISGGHINPAVTLAIFLRGKLHVDEIFLYWASQFIGGLVGALLGGVISGQFAVPAVGQGHSLFQAWLAEFLFTTLLCFVVLCVATLPKSAGNHYFGLSIGVAVFVGAVSAGGISGGAFNPAVIVGLTGAGEFWKLWKYGYAVLVVSANLTGAVTAVCIFQVTTMEDTIEDTAIVSTANSFQPASVDTTFSRLPHE